MTHADGFDYRWRDPYAAPQARGEGLGGAPAVGDTGAPPPTYRRSVESGMIIERNVPVTMRDGIKLLADVFRPIDESPAPPIIAWGPYGKHQQGNLDLNPKTNVRPGMVSQYAMFEGPDPAYWVPAGYAVVNVDSRGTWYSEGDATFLSPEEARDYYDLIEWAGVQPWSNGKVGTIRGLVPVVVPVARRRSAAPPSRGDERLGRLERHLSRSRVPRRHARHHVLDARSSPPRGARARGASRTWWPRRPSTHCSTPTGPRRRPTSRQIVVPAFIVASWGDQGLHTRGTLEGFKHMASQQKWLEIHGRKKWSYFYEPESVGRLREFFDHFLKGLDTPLKDWPRVRMEVRERYYVGEIRGESEWPLARAVPKKLYLNAREGTLAETPVESEASISYSSLGSGPGAHRAEFECVFDRDTELVGHAKLKIFMSTDDSDDMDVFVGLYKFDAQGRFVPMAYYTFFEDGPVALGWLRASHRELDEERSTEFQPVHIHAHEQKLAKGEVVPLEIEIWPSGTSFRAGERLRLIVQGTDLQKYSKVSDPVYARHEDTVNSGNHFVHTGPGRESFLLVPLIAGESRDMM